LTEYYNFYLKRLIYLTTVLLFVSLITPAFAEELDDCQNNKNQIVTFKINTIFNEDDEGIYFIHRLANWLHIDTQPITLNNEAAFFIQKCIKKQEDMDELERHLRHQKYLRAANVTADDEHKNITVETWDNWSLMPTLSFGREGGVNKYSFGIKDRNLLGLGIDAELESYSNAQREGYTIKLNSPLFQKENTRLAIKFADNDDGTQKALSLHKTFASFYTDYAYNFGFNEESRQDTIFQNGEDQTNFNHAISYKNLSYAWLKANDKYHVFRYQIGITQDQHLFTKTDDTITLLPQDREFIYPWLGIEYIEKDFQELTNIHLISQIEDFNNGWQLNTSVGLGNGDNNNSAWLFYNSAVKKGFQMNDYGLLLMNFQLSADIFQHQSDRILAALNSEYFYRFTDNWGFYLHNVNVLSQNQYSDNPVSIGGNNGLRGFPLQYQQGEHSIQLTAELRYYPEINLFKLFDVAAAAFFDSGKAFGESIAPNATSDILYSAGVGLRLYTPHSGGSNSIIHIDFAFPMADDENIDGFEIRVQAKRSF
jgi:hypothetical protein